MRELAFLKYFLTTCYTAADFDEFCLISQGILKKMEHGSPDGDINVTVDFPESDMWHLWNGLYSQLEKVPGSGIMVSQMFHLLTMQ